MFHSLKRKKTAMVGKWCDYRSCLADWKSWVIPRPGRIWPRVLQPWHFTPTQVTSLLSYRSGVMLLSWDGPG